MTKDTLFTIIMAIPVILAIWGIVSFITKGMSTSSGSDFVGDVITGQFAAQDKRKAAETIHYEKEDKRYTDAEGEKYDDILPAINGDDQDQSNLSD